MNWKESIKTLEDLHGRGLITYDCLHDLRGNILSQQDKINQFEQRLDQFEEKCPDCKGVGGFYDAGEGTEDRCETCKGSGRIPICYLPNNVVKHIHKYMNDLRGCQVLQESAGAQIRQKGQKLTSESMFPYLIKMIFPSFSITKQPNNRWKLERIKL